LESRMSLALYAVAFQVLFDPFTMAIGEAVNGEERGNRTGGALVCDPYSPETRRSSKL
jgi:hypothetical protein